jgi:hypothetical protein
VRAFYGGAGGVNARSRDKFGFDFVPIAANMIWLVSCCFATRTALARRDLVFLMRFTERACVNYTAEDVKNSPNSAVRLTFPTVVLILNSARTSQHLS